MVIKYSKYGVMALLSLVYLFAPEVVSKSDVRNLESVLSSQKIYSGIFVQDRGKYPYELEFKKFDKKSKKFRGEMNFTSLKTKVAIAGKIEGDGIVFMSKKYIKKGDFALDVLFNLHFVNNRLMEGTWSHRNFTRVKKKELTLRLLEGTSEDYFEIETEILVLKKTKAMSLPNNDDHTYFERYCDSFNSRNGPVWYFPLDATELRKLAIKSDLYEQISDENGRNLGHSDRLISGRSPYLYTQPSFGKSKRGLIRMTERKIKKYNINNETKFFPICIAKKPRTRGFPKLRDDKINPVGVSGYSAWTFSYMGLKLGTEFTRELVQGKGDEIIYANGFNYCTDKNLNYQNQFDRPIIDKAQDYYKDNLLVKRINLRNNNDEEYANKEYSAEIYTLNDKIIGMKVTRLLMLPQGSISVDDVKNKLIDKYGTPKFERRYGALIYEGAEKFPGSGSGSGSLGRDYRNYISGLTYSPQKWMRRDDFNEQFFIRYNLDSVKFYVFDVAELVERESEVYLKCKIEIKKAILKTEDEVTKTKESLKF